MSDSSLAATYILASIHNVLINAVGIGVIFQLYPDEAAYYIQVRGFIFGLGALTGPKVVGWMGLNTNLVFSLCNLLPLAIFAAYSIPNIETAHESDSTSPKRSVSLRAELMVCGVMFVYAGMENGLASWMPTYAIKTNVAITEGSSFYSLLFWLPNCFCRLVWLYFPGKVIDKLRLAFSLILLASCACLSLQIFEMY